MPRIENKFTYKSEENIIPIDVETQNPTEDYASQFIHGCGGRQGSDESGFELTATSNHQKNVPTVEKTERTFGIPRQNIYIHKNTLVSLEETAPNTCQVEEVPRKRKNSEFESTSTSKRHDLRREKLIIQESDSDDELDLDYGPGGHLELYEQSLLANRYEIIKPLGYGVYGAVYMATDTDECETVAVKVGKCGEEANVNSSQETKFTKMVTGLANCTKLLDSFEEIGPHGKHFVLVFEVLGPNLFDVLYRSNQGELTTDRLKKFLKNILNGVMYMHDELGLIHGDLKPANLMLTVPISEVGTSTYNVFLRDDFCMTSLKIGDFGITCEASDVVQWSIQTCAYRAPESFFVSNISTPADIWSVGCIAYEMATQEALFSCCHANAHQEKMNHLTKIASELGPIEACKFEINESNRAIFKEVFGRGEIFCGKMNKNLKLSVVNLVDKSDMTLIEADLFLDFLRHLMIIDPKKRLTAKEALKHPFIMG